jgi:hypothetical protein
MKFLIWVVILSCVWGHPTLAAQTERQRQNRPATVMGRVRFADKKPAKGVVITLGSTGVPVARNGMYRIVLHTEGRLPVYFTSPDGSTEYHLVGEAESYLFVRSGDSIVRDFTIEK